MPRLPLSVSALAGRYEVPAENGGSGQTSPRTPVDDRYRSPPAPTARVGSPEASRMSPAQAGAYNLNEGASNNTLEELARRRQRLQELEELELREQEYELRLKEREIEQRTRQLEQDRMRLLSARGMLADGYESDHSHNNLRIPMTDSPVASPQTRHPYASSSTQLPPPRQPQRYASQQSLVNKPPPSPTKPPPATSHPPYCGCEACAPKHPPAPRDPTPSPRTEVQPVLAPLTLRPDKHDKPKGWIRRLSMPVMGNAFSDKKGISNTSYTPNAAMRNSLVYTEEDGRLDKTRSTTTVGRR